MKNTILTVDQVAEILNLHPKTVRQFIRAGKLKAHKVGKQWRIMQNDLSAFMGGDISLQTAGDDSRITRESFTRDKGSPEPKIQVSAVVDIRVKDQEEAMRLSNSIIAVLNCKDPAYGQARSDFMFYEEEKRARFILWGEARFMGDLLILLSHISEQ